MNFKTIIDHMNHDESFLMFVLIIVNLLSRVVDLKLTLAQESMLRMIPPEVLIFLAVFLGVRNVVLAAKAAAFYSIAARVFLNEAHPLCVLSKSRVRKLHRYSSTDTQKIGCQLNSREGFAATRKDVPCQRGLGTGDCQQIACSSFEYKNSYHQSTEKASRFLADS